MTFRSFEVAWFVAYLLTLGWMLKFGASRRKKKQQTPAEVQTEIMGGVGTYLCGNTDLSRLRLLAAEYPDEMQEALIRYEGLVAGQRDDVANLAIALGFVQGWWYDAQSRDVEERRAAFVSLGAFARQEPVRRMISEVAVKGFRDEDAEVRLQAARVLVATGEQLAVERVFEGALSLAPDARIALSGELAPFAAMLCQGAIPRSLASDNPLPALQILNAWQNALPLAGLGSLTQHEDRAIRLEAVRLLRYLPSNPGNEKAISAALIDEDEEVRDAAAGAIRLGVPKLDCAANAAASTLRQVQAEIKDLVHRVANAAAPLGVVSSAEVAANPFTSWRLLDAEE